MQKSYEWYISVRSIELVREVLGTIELDPASCKMASQIIQVTRYYDVQTDGLQESWHVSTVFPNPPAISGLHILEA